MSENTEQASGNTKSRLRTIILLAGLLIGEAAVIIGVLTLFGGPPAVQAESGIGEVQVPEEEKIVEHLVVDGRFPNSKRGVTYLYDTEVYVQVQRQHEHMVASELEQFRNEIKAELTAIWRTSEPNHFDEPKLENLTRKVYALLNDRFGVDPATDEPIVIKVVIVMGSGLRIEG
ncbi:MAG: hypothetical protein ACYTJ0_16660 [Planctomycetota bacterium]|jgi:hypothetical protein